MKNKVLLLFIFMALLSALHAQHPQNDPNWQPVFEDNFNTFNSSRWYNYNTVLAVNQNFYYASVDNKDYPYYSHEGDTIMFYGNVGRMEYSYPDSSWVRLTFFDTSGGNGVGHPGGGVFDLTTRRD